MAYVDADVLFTTIDVGEVGRNSDGAVFRTSNLGRSLNLGVLQLPPMVDHYLQLMMKKIFIFIL